MDGERKPLRTVVRHIGECVLTSGCDGSHKRCVICGTEWNTSVNPNPRTRCQSTPTEIVGYSFWCPGCKHYHWFNVVADEHPKGEKWSFNGNMDKPTFSPSLLHDEPMESGKRCHLHVQDGIIKYCGDCSHALAGKEVPLQLGDY